MTAILKKSISGLFLLASLLLFSSLKAQTGNPIAGYTYLGQCQGHHYYVSNAPAMWPTANTAALGLGGYLATLTSQIENDCVWNFYRTLLLGTGGLAPQTGGGTTAEYDDDRHAWIGYSDLGSEGTWSWTNGENCESFSNWDLGEPNNFNDPLGPQGEDYALMLAFEDDGIPGNARQGGKWNDWYNTHSQRYIVEFGPSRCLPPNTRGDEGCSHGYWKSASKKWWFGSVGVGAALYQRGDNFFTEFGIAPTPANRRGLNAALTLDGALNLGGGSYNNVARQGVAALLNAADPDVNFPYTEAEIINAVSDMFETGSAQLPDPTTNYTTMGTYNVGQLGDLLDWANNLGCPINAQGNRTETINSQEMSLNLSELSIKALPNPSSGAFNIQFNSGSIEKISLKVMDMQGKLIEKRENVLANQTLQIGQNYNAGVYFIDVMQGSVRKNLRLVKTK